MGLHLSKASSAYGGEALSVNPREERNRYLITFALSAPAAAIVWYVFHGVYEDLTQTEKAVGYVDPLTQTGIYLGYVVMVGGTLIFAAIALWAAIRWLRLLLSSRR
jgi:hypothetical protein